MSFKFTRRGTTKYPTNVFAPCSVNRVPSSHSPGSRGASPPSPTRCRGGREQVGCAQAGRGWRLHRHVRGSRNHVDERDVCTMYGNNTLSLNKKKRSGITLVHKRSLHIWPRCDKKNGWIYVPGTWWDFVNTDPNFCISPIYSYCSPDRQENSQRNFSEYIWSIEDFVLELFQPFWMKTFPVL